VLDTRIPDGLTDIRQGGWTLDDLCHAHDLLDEDDRVRARQRAQQREAARLARAQP